MPIKFSGHTFDKFKQAVRFVQRSKGLPKRRAAAYVASIARKQEKL